MDEHWHTYWCKLGKIQFDFVISQGLKSDYKYLDIGCGNFRAGRHVMKYLINGNYYGIDNRDYGGNIIKDFNLSKYNFHFKRTDTFEIESLKYDMIMAWSVFTHLSDENIKLCVKNVSSNMNTGCKFFATFFPPRSGTKYGRVGGTGPNGNWVYPFSLFQDMAKENNLNVVHMKDFNVHPNPNQNMLMFTPI